ncbi:MAG TPA: F0F1 ATP synthase subunit epsilon [Rhizomicrobium sp.]|nr:F0F1 ATP synthase subunit epsilon [Rhizomicrobium sp.]
MRLVISTPTYVVADIPNATAIRAEDESGSFGILEGHADFLTVVSISILRWRQAGGAERYCAHRRGVLSVIDGHEVRLAVREAVLGTDPEQLEAAVLTRFREAADEEQSARAESLRLQMTAIRRIIHYLRPEGSSMLTRRP